MIKKLLIGETVVLPQHPFSVDTSIKIGGNANYTSPILNVADVLIARGYETDTTQLIPTKKASQALCYYYSNKLGTFEKHWFSLKELKNISNEDSDNCEIKIVNGKISTNTNEGDEVICIPNSEQNIDVLKENYLHKTVILKSADLELSKEKFHWQQLLEDKDKFNIENYHEFLSPIMTVIDVVENKNFNNDRLDGKSGNIKRLPNKFFFKCKWFNPVKQNFSEELLPPQILKQVVCPDNLQLFINAINSKNIFTLIINDCKKLVKIKKVVQVHHTFRAVYWDILLQKNESEIITSNIVIEETKFELKNLFETPIEFDEPDEINPSKDEYYQIKYLDKANRITNRIIKCKSENGKAIIADCTLRNNDERIFRKEGILMIRKAKKDFKDLIHTKECKK